MPRNDYSPVMRPKLLSSMMTTSLSKTSLRHILKVSLLYLCLWIVPPVFASTIATTTTLSFIADGNVVTTVSSPTVVTLTATVQANGAPLTKGLVKFCDTLQHQAARIFTLLAWRRLQTQERPL